MNPMIFRLPLALVLFSAATLQAETVLLDFGNSDSFRGISVPDPDENGNYWNSVKPGAFFSNLVDVTNTVTDIDFGPGSHGTDSYNGPAGPTDGGITEIMLLTLDIDKVALGNLGVAEAAIDFHVGKLGDASGYFQLQGLDSASQYTLTFFCSHKYNASDITRINVYDDADRLNLIASGEVQVGSGAVHNTRDLIVLADLTPSSSGIFYLEFGGADGANSGYISSLEISTEGGGGGPDPDPDPEPDEGIKLVVAGSSVPAGFAASLAGSYRHDYDQENDTGKDYWDYSYGIYGYAGRLRLALTAPEKPQVPGGSTTDWEFVNVSVPGDNTTLVNNRFDPDVTRQYAAPKVTHAEPEYVIIALSLANEGLVFTSNPQSVFDSFKNGMQNLIQKCEDQGYYPVITYVYPHADYTPEKYEYVKQMNLLMNSWGVTAINLLGAIDNGMGQWADGFVYDPGHPNFQGHEEMYLSIPPTLFDAIHFDGKREVPSYPVEEEFLQLVSDGETAENLTFTPGDKMRSYTNSFKLRTESAGTVAAVRAKYEPLFLVDFGPSNDDDGRATASPDALGQHWNNWRASEGGTTVPVGALLENLTLYDGSASSIGLETVTAFGGTNGIVNGGLTTPDPELLGHFAVATATEDYFYSTGTSTLRITGLDPEKQYTFRFFGTRASNDLRETRYRVTGTTSEINFSPYADIVTSGVGLGSDGVYNGNDSGIGLVSGITPRSNGEVFVEILPDAGGFAYLGAMEVSVDTAVDRYATVEVRSGEIAYVSADGREMTAPVDVADNEWHDIALAHRYAQQQTLLFVDGVEVAMLRENLEPDQFVLGGNNLASAPASADVQDWAVYRAAWNEDEAAAQAAGTLQHASMEILAPLSDSSFVNGQPVENRAQSRSEAVYNGAGVTVSESFWKDVPADPSVPGAKGTGIGPINDAAWPFVYHYGPAHGWLAVHEDGVSSKDGFYAYSFTTASWIWTSDSIGGWYFDLTDLDWYAFN
ncbi:hypothetical protein G0Q06_10070 [Puniceicoccales bacterium CK1056]|uniref:SGNH hydrolase-type esterase domain-containing protein n=1 Tax=Oceanipulchritudo coccoides TaxID=2706888 RepID=A0A6B2M312_9BACT|nr:hypothetical protein [Oceanipulchritudo coccoides]NDV62796.1 hypothetical protein [Oceanipulchritudo coccoides]